MPRPDLYLPPGTTVETTTRTLCGMFLLPANPYFSKIVVGILARAQEKYPVKIHFGSMLSNHYHLLLTPDDREQLADFMEFVNGNLGREVLALVEDWDEKCWGDRYHPIPVTDEPEALEARLRYAISHGVKENLVARVADWEGFHCAQALLDGKPLHGIWIDRSKLYEAERRGKTLERDEYVKNYFLKLDPLPCWMHLTTAQRRRRFGWNFKGAAFLASGCSAAFLHASGCGVPFILQFSPLGVSHARIQAQNLRHYSRLSCQAHHRA